MIIGNNIVATPLVIIMVAVTMVTTVTVEVVAADHLNLTHAGNGSV